MTNRTGPAWTTVLLIACWLGSGIVAGCSFAAPSIPDGCTTAPSRLVKLKPVADCDKCRDTLLPGRIAPNPNTAYTLWSDLPEVFCSTGVLYASADTLPPDKNGNPPAAMRRQVRDKSFRGIDGAFDVFFFHTIYGCTEKAPRRIVVYVRNDGDKPATLFPTQIIISDGVIGRVHEMESSLGRRALQDDWDRPIPAVTIAPGKGAVVAYSKRFGMPQNGDDASRNVNCFGRVRVNTDGKTTPRLAVYVVAIDAAPKEENETLAEKALARGALSGEKYIDFNTRPSGCQVRRATGVFRSFTWRNDPIVIDADSLTSGPVVFPMALWERASRGCPDARQSADLILHPEYTRSDTIGNYMVDYRIRIRLVNRSRVHPRRVDIRFGKSDADIGLAWRVAVGDDTLQESAVAARPIRTGWAGPKQDAPTRSFLASEGGPIKLGPCETRVVALHFLVLGNSSLPFYLRVEPAAKTP